MIAVGEWLANRLADGQQPVLDPVLAAPPERRFLRYALRAGRDPEALAEAERLADLPGFDWEAVKQQAAAENVGPLLHKLLPAADWLPAAVAGAWVEAYTFTARRNIFLLHELEKALATLSAGGIEVLVLKGAALAESVYDNIAVRPVRDLDLLLHHEDVPPALALLKALGYAPTEVEAYPGMTLAYENEILLRKAGGLPVYLELHWSLLDSPHYQRQLQMGWFWETARPLSGSGVPASMLGPEALLLHLCAHLLLHHRGDELLWLYDVAEVVHYYHEEVDWDCLLERAQAFDLVLPVQQVLARVTSGWGAPVPRDVLARLNALSPSAAEAKVFRWVRPQNRPTLQRFLVDLTTMPGWHARLDYCLRHLFPSRAYMERQFPDARPGLLPFYYPYRWLSGLYAFIAGAHARGD